LNFTLNWAVEKEIFTPQPPLTLRSGLKVQGGLYPRLPSWGAERQKMIRWIILAKEPDCRADLWWRGWGWIKTGTDYKSTPADYNLTLNPSPEREGLSGTRNLLNKVNFPPHFMLNMRFTG